MAGIDYHYCDVCRRVRCFYDGDLDYRSGAVSERTGKQVPDNSADVAAICHSCIKTHEIVIQERKAVTEHDEIMRIIEERAKQLGWTSAELIQEYLTIAVKTLKETKLV